MNYIKKGLLGTVGTAALFSGVGVVNAAPVTNVYQHGLYSQAHFKTQADCDKARTAAITAVKNYKGVVDKAGACHYMDGLAANKTAQKGYMYDLTYKRTAAIWYTDVNSNLGPATKVTPLTGAHSFKFKGSYATQAEAKSVEANRANFYNTTSGYKLTWRSGVVQDPVSKKWVYEIDYNSRVPSYAGHIQISEKPDVTTKTLGSTSIVAPAPSEVLKENPTKPDIVNPAPVKPEIVEPSTTPGIDISPHTVINDWQGWKNAGYKWMYIKASEGNYHTSKTFNSQYTDAYKNGFIRGAYHFANPGVSNGADQADYFLARGGGWSPDGQTLPGALDLEWNPYKSTANGDACYGLSKQQMADWTNSFVNQYKARTGTYPVIYSATSWWNQCVGDKFTNANVPFWQAYWAAKPGATPFPWATRTFWQYAAVDAKGIDLDSYQGTLTSLKKFATTGAQ